MNDTTTTTALASAPPRDIQTGQTLAVYLVNYAEELGAAANRLARSFLLPDGLRVKRGDSPEEKERKIRDVGVLLARCLTTGEDVLALAQSIYLVGGRPAMASRYLLARAQLLGLIKDAPWYDVEGTWPDIAVTAHAETKAGIVHSVTVSMTEAREDGWAGRNAKYRNEMPATNMLRHRAAARLIDQIAPGIRLGIPIAEEVQDTVDQFGAATPPTPKPRPAGVRPRTRVVDVTPEPPQEAPTAPEAAPEVEADPTPPEAAPAPLSAPQNGRGLLAEVKAQCAELEERLSGIAVADLRERLGPTGDTPVHAWRGRMQAAVEYRDALKATVEVQAGDGGEQ